MIKAKEEGGGEGRGNEIGKKERKLEEGMTAWWLIAVWVWRDCLPRVHGAPMKPISDVLPSVSFRNDWEHIQEHTSTRTRVRDRHQHTEHDIVDHEPQSSHPKCIIFSMHPSHHAKDEIKKRFLPLDIGVA